MLVSLIVVTYNSAALLPAFFAALETTGYAPYELLVVDNASADATLAYLQRHQPQAHVLASPTNLGFGRACNLGAAAAKGELLVFLNPDVAPAPGWLTALVETMRARPDAGVLCPETPEPGQAAERAPGAPRLRESAAAPGCALLLRRAAWEQLGGFDPQIFLYWEDTDLCWRAWMLGWRVLIDSAALVYHARGGSGGGAWDAERTKNSLYVTLKLRQWRHALPFAALLGLKTLAKIGLRRAPGLGAAWGWNLRHLGATLAQRRELRRRSRCAPADLERLIVAHERRQARERRERKHHARARP